MSILQPSASSIEKLRHKAMFSRFQDMGITVGHVASIENMRNAYIIFVGKSEEGTSLGRHRDRY
jgi:hypothetical protein